MTTSPFKGKEQVTDKIGCRSGEICDLHHISGMQLPARRARPAGWKAARQRYAPWRPK
jgi:hypothetical protein